MIFDIVAKMQLTQATLNSEQNVETRNLKINRKVAVCLVSCVAAELA